MNTRNSHSSPSAVAVFVCFWDKPDDKSGFAAQFQLWLPCRGAGSTHRCRHWLHRGQLSSRERITQHGRDNRISGDADASKGCRIADPYRVNSHNHINRGRMISATTRFNICYPLHFCGRTNFASMVHILKLLAKSQFVNPLLS